MDHRIQTRGYRSQQNNEKEHFYDEKQFGLES